MVRQVSVGLLRLIVDHYSTCYPYLRGTVEGDDSVALFHLIVGLDNFSNIPVDIHLTVSD